MYQMAVVGAALSCAPLAKGREAQPVRIGNFAGFTPACAMVGVARVSGLFIHWGPISLKGTEIGWSRIPGPDGAAGGSVPAEEYDALYHQFNPTNFDAKEWVAVAQAAGMKYIVFTTKTPRRFLRVREQTDRL